MWLLRWVVENDPATATSAVALLRVAEQVVHTARFYSCRNGRRLGALMRSHPEFDAAQEHKPSRMIVEDTGLGIDRTDKVVVVQVVSRPRTKEKKQALYQLMCEELEKSCGIAPSDVMVAIVENTDEDWSFGLGRAQFLTGDL